MLLKKNKVGWATVTFRHRAASQLFPALTLSEAFLALKQQFSTRGDPGILGDIWQYLLSQLGEGMLLVSGG